MRSWASTAVLAHGMQQYWGKTAQHFWTGRKTIGCCVNYAGSSNAMEVEMAKCLWSRSEEKRLHYTGFLIDVDSKAYHSVVEMQPYGDTPIEKEECINHTHKWMASLPNFFTNTDWQYWVTMPTFETLKLWLVSMRKAVFATLFHLMSTDESPHHNRCPTGQDSSLTRPSPGMRSQPLTPKKSSDR